VNPVVVNSPLDVFTVNRRDVTTITLPDGGKLVSVAVGAMLVGSVVQSRKEGDVVKRGEELGGFKYGGSTVLNIFKKGTVQWDDDLITNSNTPIETVVRVGEKIGRFV
jgi:phosphatidylserine decarboxylase